jgi:hypothetical protein
MWYRVFLRDPDECMFNLWIDNGMIMRLIPFGIPALSIYWRYSIRYVPADRNYRFIVDNALTQNRLVAGPLVTHPVIPQHVLAPSNNLIHVLNFFFYAAYYRASENWDAETILTGWTKKHRLVYPDDMDTRACE